MPQEYGNILPTGGAVDLGAAPDHLASALYKLVYGSARASKESLKEVEGLKAFLPMTPPALLMNLKNFAS